MMDFEDSGIDSDPKSCAGTGTDFDFLSHKNEPIISFSPDRCRYESNNGTRNSSIGSNDITGLVIGDEPSPTIIIRCRENSLHGNSNQEPQSSTTLVQESMEQKACEDSSGLSPTTPSSCSNNDSQNHIGSQLQRRLEKHIAQASMGSNKLSYSSNSRTPSSIAREKGNYAERRSSMKSAEGSAEQSFNHSSRHPMTATGIPNTTTSTARTTASIATSSSTTLPSACDTRRVPGLLPPQRLAIPHKSNSASSTHHSNTQEFKPLVQWDSEESEEELSFFPAPKQRGTLTDNLSIDNMSLSGEEDDLHLSPPRVMTSRCPCDPRLLIDSKFSASSSAPASAAARRGKQCVIV